MTSIQNLAQQLLNGNDTSLNEIQHLKGHDAQVLLDIIKNSKDHEAYKKATTAIWKPIDE